MASRNKGPEAVANGGSPNGCVGLEILSFSQCVLIRVPPPASNPCGSNNGGCEQVCVLSHRTDNDGLGYRCKCEFGFELDTDERHCVGKKSAFPVFLSGGVWVVWASFFCPASSSCKFSSLRRVQCCSLCIEPFTSKTWFLVQGFLPETAVPFYYYELLAMAFRFCLAGFELFSTFTSFLF